MSARKKPTMSLLGVLEVNATDHPSTDKQSCQTESREQRYCQQFKRASSADRKANTYLLVLTDQAKLAWEISIAG
jgi:hypothetical protein